MNNIVDLLHTGGYSCVIANGDDIRTFNKGGVRDLYELYTNDPSFLKGASMADKIVGKAAATLMILGNIKQIHADVISESAIALFRNIETEVKFDTTVPFIENRDKTGVCPLENICNQTNSVEELFPLIEKFIEKMRR